MLSLKYFTTEHFQCPFVYFLNYLFILYCWLLLILFDPSTHPSFFFCLSGCCGRRLSTVLQFLLDDPEVFIGRILGLSLSFLLGVHVFKILLRATSRRHTGRDATFLTQRCRNPSRYLSSSPFLAGSSCLWLDLQSYSFNHYPHPIIKLGVLCYCECQSTNPPSSLVNATLRYLNTLDRGKYSPPTQKKQY